MTKPVNKPKGTVSVSTYQTFDGSNLTVCGIEEKLNGKKGYISAFLGAATNFSDDGMFVIDLKGGRNYDIKGLLNQNLRIRTKLGENSESVQFRYSPISLDVPVGKNTNIYINPHYSGQMDFKKEKWTNSIGVFGGVTQKLNDKASLSLEIQRYNLQNIKENTPENWGINAIISYKF